MKKLLNMGLSALFLGLFFISCNDDDYQTIESIGRIQIDSVKIANDTMDVFSVQSIKTYSTYSSQCEGFYGYDYIYENDFDRSVTAYRYVKDGPCGQNMYTGASQINFSPRYKGNYTFRFWNGGNQWITKTIVVE